MQDWSNDTMQKSDKMHAAPKRLREITIQKLIAIQRTKYNTGI
jgi:hypothetical protein